MRIRKPFAGAFAVFTLLAGYTGLAPIHIPYSQYHSDKVLHFLTFFILTLTFYWTLDTTRRRIIHLTLVICTLSGAIGSEILQAILPNGRDFDYFDIAANLLGSLAALGLCAAYHRRMLERKRMKRGYRSVPGDVEGGVVEDGVGAGIGADGEGVELQEATGVTMAGETESVDLDGELERWDENVEDDWGDQPVDEVEAGSDAPATTAAAVNGSAKEPLPVPVPPDAGMGLSLDTDLKAKT